jgi:hypothetical protein
MVAAVNDRAAFAEALIELVELHNEQRWIVHEVRQLLTKQRAIAKRQAAATANAEKRFAPPVELNEALTENYVDNFDDDQLSERFFNRSPTNPLPVEKTVEQVLEYIEKW